MDIEQMRILFDQHWAMHHSGESQFLKDISFLYFKEGFVSALKIVGKDDEHMVPDL